MSLTIDHLPNEILTQILKKGGLKCRLICKKWNMCMEAYHDTLLRYHGYNGNFAHPTIAAYRKLRIFNIRNIMKDHIELRIYAIEASEKMYESIDNGDLIEFARCYIESDLATIRADIVGHNIWNVYPELGKMLKRTNSLVRSVHERIYDEPDLTRRINYFQELACLKASFNVRQSKRLKR